MIKIKKKSKKMNKYLFRYLVILVFTTLSFNFASAEKVECELLSPIKKKIYQGYCKSVEKKNAAAQLSNNKDNNQEKSKSLLKKGLGKINMDSKLTDWIKDQRKK